MEMAKSVNKRVEKWDNLKFILIFLVVLGHICEMYMERTPVISGMIYVIYSFHMPLFLFVSGLFSKKNIDGKRYKKIFSYFLIYLLIKVLCCLSNIIFHGNGTFSLLSERGIPWYAFAMFAFSLITIGLKNFLKRYVMIASVIFACFAGYDSSVSDFFVLSRIIVFYPFFFAGYCIDANCINKILSKKIVKIVSGVMLAVFAIVVFWKIEDINWMTILFTGRNPFSVLGKYAPYGSVLRLIYYPFVFLIGAMVISATPEKTPKGIVATLGSRSLQVFALHKIFMDLFYHGLNGNAVLEKIWPAHYNLLTIPLALIIVLICSLKIWKPLFDLVTTSYIKKEK